MIKKGIYAAALSVINEDYSLNIQETVLHAEKIISDGLHGVFFFGSTGQSQLISINEKKEFIYTISSHRLKKNFFLGTGCNSLNENLDLINYSLEYGFNTFLIMPPAYYKKNTFEGVYDFYREIIKKNPKIKIIIYNFEKLSGFKFKEEDIIKLVKNFPKNIIGCKDSSYNLYKSLKLQNFLMFPGSESKLIEGLKIGCAGCISAVTNVTNKLAREVFDQYQKEKIEDNNNRLINIRNAFDQFNLIPALHSYMSIKNKNFSNLLPPLRLLNAEDKKKLLSNLSELKFIDKKDKAA